MQSRGPWWHYIDWRVFVPVLLGGFFLHYVYPEHWWFAEVVRRGLSEAMMIAAILGITVDRVAKDKLLGEVSADIWHQLMGRNLPPEIKAFIKSALLDTKIVCTQYRVRYRFEERRDGRLDVFVDSMRILENFGSTSEDYEASSTTFLSEEPEYLCLVCETFDGGFAWPQDPAAASIEDKDGTRTLTARKIRLAAHGEEGSRITQTYQRRIVMRPTDTDISAHWTPSTNTEIVVDAKPAWLDFMVDQQPKPVGHIWRINRVLWHGAYFRVRWFDRREAPSKRDDTTMQREAP